MKTLHTFIPGIILLTSTLCPAQESATAVPRLASEPASSAYELANPELRRVLQDAVRAMKSVTELLETVQDKATADAAADKLKVRMLLLDELSFGMQYIPLPIVNKAMIDAGITQERAEGLQKRLEAARFYHSTALATAMGAPAYLALEQAELPPEQLAQLKQTLTAAAAQHPGLTGGPGLSQDTAWNLPPDSQEIVVHILQTLDSKHPIGQAVIHRENGQKAMKYTIVLDLDGKVCPIEQWFNFSLPTQTTDDASPHDEELDTEPADEPGGSDIDPEYTDEEDNFDDMEITVEPGGSTEMEEEPNFPPEEQAAALRTFVEGLNEMVNLLNQVTDTASAQNVAQQVKALRERLSTLNDILPTISGMEIIEAMEKSGGATPADIDKLQQRLEQAEYYQCDELRRALRD
ncbi:MAG: hypothetical protein IKZ07_09235 [Akkermansia sp.]|nr:hypothetical protein [Akkermansia sp.]